MLITTFKRDFIIRICNLKGCHTTETDLNFNPLLHENFSLGMKTQSGDSKGRNEGRRNLQPKSPPRLMTLVSVFSRRNSPNPQMLSEFITRYSQFKKVRNHEPQNFSSKTCFSSQKALIENTTGTCFDCGTSEVLITVLHKSTIAVRIFYSSINNSTKIK